MENATVVLSGTKLAQEISSTRSEVWRLVQQLRSLGVEVAGHPATGYRLKSVPDLLLPEILKPMLQGTIFAEHVRHAYKIGSTNTAAMSAAAEGVPEGTVFLAEEQTAGRGRGAHTWESARSSGIYCSVILRPPLAPADVIVLALAAGLAVCNAITELVPRVSFEVNPEVKPEVRKHILKCDLKWPNDVLIDDKKVAGILAEMNAEATRVRYVVVGIGINVNQSSFPPELQSAATSLCIETGCPWSRVELTAVLLKSLDREYRALLEQKYARQSILRRFAEQSSWVRGKQVRILENGATAEGTTEGLDDCGFLLLRTPTGLQKVLSGTVRAR